MLSGLLDCSFSWFVNNNTEKCLPFILADQGYDVWLMNNRGNKYSMGHRQYINLMDNFKFWDFSIDEMALYDVVALVDYVI